MANANGILSKLDRKAEISTAKSSRFINLRSAAERLSLRNVDAAVTELLNEALSHLTVLVYETDENRFCNIDHVTGKVLIALPWGKAGYKKWALTPSEADTLRRIMFNRQRTGEPLFFFDRSRRAWFVNIKEYAVQPVIAEWEITLAEYRIARREGSKKGRKYDDA